MARIKVKPKMKVISSIQQMKKMIDRHKKQGETIGFVPTMGYLHEGHLALVKQAKDENDLVVMSIFVNPAQFGPGEDYETYPRNEQRDFALATEAGVDLVFMPDVVEMYPRKSTIHISPGDQADALCGMSRPGHFDGVLKVILKLFNIIEPTRSYFGMKDAQQLAIIETFVKDFNFNTEIRRVATVREADGLAKSSRNVRLSERERSEAPIIYQALMLGKQVLLETEDVEETERQLRQLIEESCSGNIDYITVLDYPSLEKWTRSTKEAIIACAVQFEKTRLIDNVILKGEAICLE